MRFTLKAPPRKGDKRTKRKFAWLPTFIDERTLIWLEHYYSHQEFVNMFGPDGTAQIGWREKHVMLTPVFKKPESTWVGEE